jgi:hypothetical protein
MKKSWKRILFALIILVVLTHRHEDYCSKHPHRNGTLERPYYFGQRWIHKDTTSQTPPSKENDYSQD